MAHQIDRCDIIDILEEAVTTGRAVRVELTGHESATEAAKRFVDHVRDVTTSDGEDYAVFKEHGRFAVSEIRKCESATVREI